MAEKQLDEVKYFTEASKGQVVEGSHHTSCKFTINSKKASLVNDLRHDVEEDQNEKEITCEIDSNEKSSYNTARSSCTIFDSDESSEAISSSTERIEAVGSSEGISQDSLEAAPERITSSSSEDNVHKRKSFEEDSQDNQETGCDSTESVEPKKRKANSSELSIDVI